MTPVYPTVRIYLDQDGDDIPETDVSGLVVSAISGQHGNFNQKDSDRVSAAGSITLEIENKTMAYTGADFIGKALAVVLEYAGHSKQIYFGHVQAPTDDDSGPILPLHIQLTVPDWLHTANSARMTGLTLQTFLRADEAMGTLLDSLAIPPARRDFDVGQEIFDNMFDGSGPKAKIFSEVDKIIKSELGQGYLKFRTDGDGEILRLENRYARGSWRPLSRIPTQVSDPPLLGYHGNAGATGLLKYHGNGGESGYIKVHQAQPAALQAKHYRAERKTGANLINEMSVSNVFRTTDIGDVILYQLNYPVPIGTTQTEIIEGNYSDPNGGTVIQAFDQTILNTDIIFNSERDGSGTDLKANLKNAGTAFWTNKFKKGYRNDGPAGYLIQFIVRGKGIYKYSPNETLVQNAESVERLRMVYPDGLTREYSNDLITSRQFANSVLALRRLPNQDLLSVSYKGNTDEQLLMAFMYLEQGDKINIVEVFPDHDGDHYIQGVKFRIELGGQVDYTWFLREETETLCTPIAISAPAEDAMSAVDFGILPHLNNLPRISYSFWFRRDDLVHGNYGFPIGKSVDTGTGRRGHYLLIVNNTLEFTSYKTPTDGAWEATAVLPANTNWHHIGLSYDNTTDQADPVIYLDGSPVTVTEIGTPSGSTDDDSDCPLILMNMGRDPALDDEYFTAINDFSMKDFRVYNRILSPAEFAELAAGEDDHSTVPTGLLFCGPFAPTENIDDYIGDTIEADDLVLDIVHGAAGTPYNADLTDSTTMLTGETI